MTITEFDDGIGWGVGGASIAGYGMRGTSNTGACIGGFMGKRLAWVIPSRTDT
jgi:hypothetical protein